MPPPGLQGVIFKITPPKESVILNLTALYADPAFHAAVDTHKAVIDGYHDGIGRWQESQREVVLELGNLDQASVYSYGGFSSNRELIAELWLNRKPTPEDLAGFDELAKKAGIVPGGDSRTNRCRRERCARRPARPDRTRLGRTGISTRSTASQEHRGDKWEGFCTSRPPRLPGASTSPRPFRNGGACARLRSPSPDCSHSSSETDRGDSRADTRRAPVG